MVRVRVRLGLGLGLGLVNPNQDGQLAHQALLALVEGVALQLALRLQRNPLTLGLGSGTARLVGIDG